MTTTDIEFLKYKTRGAYHWEQISKHPIKRNAFVLGRYMNAIALLKKGLGSGLAGKRILDVGCGDGVLSYLISKEGAIVSGIDYSDLAISLAKDATKGRNIDFRQGDASNLSCYGDNEFDGVVSSDVIEHLKDVNGYLREMKRVVKHGGVVVISTPIRFTEKPIDLMHVTEWFETGFKLVIDEVFPESQFYRTHPLFWKELMERSKLTRILVNLLSFFKNPFEAFENRFNLQSLQYSISKKWA